MPKRKKSKSELQRDDVDSSAEEESVAEEEETEQLRSSRQQQERGRGRIDISNTAIRCGGAMQVKEKITAIISAPALSTAAQQLGGSSDIKVRNEGVVAESISAGSIMAHTEDQTPSSSSTNAQHEKASAALKRKNEKAYHLEGPGSVLIINNMFPKVSLAARPENPGFEVEERTGSEKDVEDTYKLFNETMGCTVFVANNIESTELRQKLDGFKAKCKDSSFCLIVVMTHGGKNTLLMEDLREVDVDEDLVYQFSEENFSGFKGRPKIFLIQACGSYGSAAEEGAVAADEGSRAAPSPSGEVANVFVGLACLSHRKAYRHTVSGSWYIQSIREIFERCWREEDLVTMHTAVEKCVFAKVAEENGKRRERGKNEIQLQTPNNKNIGFNKLFFFPQ